MSDQKTYTFTMMGHLSVPVLWTPVYDREHYITHFITLDGRVIQPFIGLSVSRDNTTAVATSEEEFKCLGVGGLDYVYRSFLPTP